jgi:ornithine cyclodeaminase
MSQSFRLLNEAEVASLLSMGELIGVMESALARFSAGDVLQPVRTVLSVGPTKAFFGVMPAYLPDPGRMGAKLVTVFNGNEARGLPSHLATILLLDAETGALCGILDGRFITEARTAAVSAVSARHLSRVEASTLAILGTGVQARSHLEALKEVRGLKDIRVWSPRLTSRERFVEEMAPHVTGTLRATRHAEQAVEGADLIVLATSSPTPVIENGWVSDGAHIMSVGACRPDQREMDPRLVARAELYVDSKAAALVESGDVVMGIREGRFGEAHLRGELGEVVLRRVHARTSHDQVTIFKSLGMAVEDVAAAGLVLDRAHERGIGQRLEI